jgi:pimeloyl-ACP methyl ester carboxylesterase
MPGHSETRREREITKKGRIPRLPVALLAAVLGALGLEAAPALAAPPSPVESPNPLIRQHLGLHQARVHTSARAAAPTRVVARRVHLFQCHEAAPDGRCGRVRVPLDRAHPSRGKIPIFFAYFRHRDPGPARRAILITEGGPGLSVTQDPFLPGFYHDVFDPLLAKRDLILLDQRGVGRSDAIDCEQIQHGSNHLYRDVRACGRQLGARSALYGTGAVALDIEAVRKALGIRKLDLYGGSYAAMDVQAYSVRFPGHVRSAVLDSPFAAIGFDDLDLASHRTLKRAIRLICARSASCSAERVNAVRDVSWLAHRLRRHPVTGVGEDANGEPHHLRVTEGFLLWRVLNTDAGGFVSLSEVGAAADSLRTGDAVPLLRLAAEGDGPLFGDQGDPTSYSQGEDFARFCTDNPMPWDKSAPIPTRLRQWRAARNALPRNSYSPFSVDAWLAPFPIGPIGPDACTFWPTPKRHVAPPIPRGDKFPGKVPALLLSGDLEPNSADAQRLEKAWPHSRYVQIANAGHHTATPLSGRFECSDAIIVHFIAKLRPGDTSCAPDANAVSYPGVGRFPLTADDARPAAVDHGRGDNSTPIDRKVATVATAAITDAFRRGFLQSEPVPGSGLRGGTFSINFGDAKATVQLSSARFAKDVAVSGSADYGYQSQAIDATVTIDGPKGEDGSLHVTGVWFGFGVPNTVLRIRGALCGRHVALRVPAT